jgi:uncharacterized membrane protein YgcG
MTTLTRLQDTEEYSFIAFTVVVKLTPDETDEPPSAMRVVGASRHFYYGPAAGDAGCFRAALHHASVPPTSEREHLKIAFFFKVCARNLRRTRAHDDAARRVEPRREEGASVVPSVVPGVVPSVVPSVAPSIMPSVAPPDQPATPPRAATASGCGCGSSGGSSSGGGSGGGGGGGGGGGAPSRRGWR